MNYVVTGAAGNVSKPLVRRLLAAGHTVTVIGRNEKNLEPLVLAGANVAIGSVEDVSFLKNAFAGADAVYTMVPTDIFAADLKKQNETIGKNFAAAIRSNDIRHVVNLSGIGAHLSCAAGPLSAIHHAEQELYKLKNVHIRTLRAVYFYQNLLYMMDMVRQMDIIGAGFSFAAGRFPVSHTDDVAAVAAEELMNLDFSGHSIRYVASDEIGTDEIAAALGKAIGKPGLPWIKFSPEQVFQNLKQIGFPENSAREYVDMYNAIDNGQVTDDYWKNRPARLEKTKLNDFAQQFAAIYKKEEKAITN